MDDGSRRGENKERSQRPGKRGGRWFWLEKDPVQGELAVFSHGGTSVADSMLFANCSFLPFSMLSRYLGIMPYFGHNLSAPNASLQKIPIPSHRYGLGFEGVFGGLQLTLQERWEDGFIANGLALGRMASVIVKEWPPACHPRVDKHLQTV